MQEELDRYLMHLSSTAGASPHTVAAYRNDLTQLVQFLTSGNATTARLASIDGQTTQLRCWADVSRTRIVAFVVSLKEKGYAPTTIARKVAAVKSFFHFLTAQGIIRSDPTENLDSPKVDKALPRSLTVEQIDALLQQSEPNSRPEEVRDAAMLQLLYATGLRVSELVALDVDDVDLTTGYLRCVGRGGRERIIPIKPAALRTLETYAQVARPVLARRRDEPALFVNHRGERLTRQGFWLILKSYVKRAGLPTDVTPQTLRHTFAVHELQHHADLQSLKDLLGHASITTTQVYAHVSQNNQEAAKPVPPEATSTR